jgi:hypothetical protein
MAAGFIKSSEILAWSTLNHIALHPCEFHTLRALDAAWVEQNAAKNKPDKPGSLTDGLKDLARLNKAKKAKKGGKNG